MSINMHIGIFVNKCYQYPHILAFSNRERRIDSQQKATAKQHNSHGAAFEYIVYSCVLWSCACTLSTQNKSLVNHEMMRRSNFCFPFFFFSLFLFQTPWNGFSIVHWMNHVKWSHNGALANVMPMYNIRYTDESVFLKWF